MSSGGDVTAASARDAYFSFFMFTVDLRPDDRAYRGALATLRRELAALDSAPSAERTPSPA